jgi:hypothetical protein
VQKVKFDVVTEIMLKGTRNLHVALHWHQVLVFRDFMVEHRSGDDQPLWLKISLVGKLESQSEVSAYLQLLRGIPARCGRYPVESWHIRTVADASESGSERGSMAGVARYV